MSEKEERLAKARESLAKKDEKIAKLTGEPKKVETDKEKGEEKTALILGTEKIPVDVVKAIVEKGADVSR